MIKNYQFLSSAGMYLDIELSDNIHLLLKCGENVFKKSIKTRFVEARVRTHVHIFTKHLTCSKNSMLSILYNIQDFQRHSVDQPPIVLSMHLNTRRFI